jgi:hypothetical protein
MSEGVVVNASDFAKVIAKLEELSIGVNNINIMLEKLTLSGLPGPHCVSTNTAQQVPPAQPVAAPHTDLWTLPENRPKPISPRIPSNNIYSAFAEACRHNHDFYLQYYTPKIGANIPFGSKNCDRHLLELMYEKIRNDKDAILGVKRQIKRLFNVDVATKFD